MKTTRDQPRTVACRLLCVIVLVVLAVAPQALPQSGGVYNLSWNTIDGGGITFATGGVYHLGGAIGQHDAGASSGGTYALTSGFWGTPFTFGGIPLRIISIVRNGNNIVVSFDAAAQKTYRLERKFTLTATMWENISGDVMASSSGPKEIIDPGVISSGKAFYQVRLLP